MNSNILNLRHLTVLLMLCTAFLGGTISVFAQQGGKEKITGQVIDENKGTYDWSKYSHCRYFYRNSDRFRR